MSTSGVFAGAAGGRLHAAWAGLWVTAPPALGVVSLPGDATTYKEAQAGCLTSQHFHACPAASQTHRTEVFLNTSAPQAFIRSCLSVQHLGKLRCGYFTAL